MPTKLPPRLSPAVRGLTRRRDDGPHSIVQGERDHSRWSPDGDDSEVRARAPDAGGRMPGRRDDRARDTNPRATAESRIGLARSPKKGAESRMPIRDEPPEDSVARKRNPRVRGA